MTRVKVTNTAPQTMEHAALGTLLTLTLMRASCEYCQGDAWQVQYEYEGDTLIGRPTHRLELLLDARTADDDRITHDVCSEAPGMSSLW